jgi:hypothetical protein
MDQSLWRVPKVLWRYQWSQSIIAGRGYTYATSYCFSVDTLLSSNTYAWHLLNSQTRENFVPSSKLDTAKVRQRRPSTKNLSLHFVRQLRKHLHYCWADSTPRLTSLTISLERITCRMTELHCCDCIVNCCG